MLAACAFTSAHDAWAPSSAPVPSSSSPVETGRTSAFSTYSRRKTWCELCDVYVWLWSTHGVSVLLAFWTSSADSSAGVAGLSWRMPSGPGWFWARVSTMKRCPGGTSSPLLATPSGPSVTSGSSSCRGTKTVPPLLTVWSTPWSKNWPKNVNHALYGGERPTSVVTFGMASVLCAGVQSAGEPGVVALGALTQGVGEGGEPAVAAVCSITQIVAYASLSWERTGNRAGVSAARRGNVWSTIRLLTRR